MNRVVSRYVLCLLIITVAFLQASAAGNRSLVYGASAEASGKTVSLSPEEELAVSLLNADRQAVGLAPLAVDFALVGLAREFAQDMIDRNYFSHNNPEGESPFDRMRRHGVAFSYAGENIGVNRTVAAAQKAFMDSYGHRANILRTKYTDVGIGVCRDAKGYVYIVQEFVGRQ